MISLSEKEITKNWKTTYPVQLSVCCLAFNHANYINKTIDSFLIQKTDFPFEIIIHDDASTDSTQLIISQYKKRFPNIIKTIIQKNNQQSKGIKVTKDFLWKEAQGKYIALCDGDDYWINEHKLQMQFEILNENSNIDICFHDYMILSNEELKNNNIARKINGKNQIISTKSVILGGGGFMLTSSIVVKSSVLKNLPSWFNSVIAGDYFIQVLGSLNSAIYIPSQMAVYRELSHGSWTEKFRKMNSAELKHFYVQSDKSMVHLKEYLKKDMRLTINVRRIFLNLAGLKNALRVRSFTVSLFFFKKSASLIFKILR